MVGLRRITGGARISGPACPERLPRETPRRVPRRLRSLAWRKAAASGGRAAAAMQLHAWLAGCTPAVCAIGWLLARGWLAACACLLPLAAPRRLRSNASLLARCWLPCTKSAHSHWVHTLLVHLGALTLGAHTLFYLAWKHFRPLHFRPLTSDRKQEASAVRRPLCMMRTSEPLMKHYSRNRRIANIGELR